MIGIFVVWTTLLCFAQTGAAKFAVVSNETSNGPTFSETLEDFITALSASPSSTRGFIALDGKNSAEIVSRYKFIKDRHRGDPPLRNRLEVTVPGMKYNGSWSQTEFWLLGKETPAPYVAKTADYDCAPLSILGESILNSGTETSGYSVDFPQTDRLGALYTFHWTVSGAVLRDGQGTTAIEVVRNKRSLKPVVVRVEVGGGSDEGEVCPKSADFKSQIASKTGKH